MPANPTGHVLPAVPANGGNYLGKLGTAAHVSLYTTSRHHPYLPPPCHKVELRPVAVHADLRTLFEDACQGVSITPEQLRRELEENGDIPDLISGALTPKALWLTAQTLALMRYPPESEHLV
jgi:hypothetical protein